MNINELIGRLAEKEPLTFEEARNLMNEITNGAATNAQIGAILMALRLNGETSEEIAGFASVMKEKSQRINPKVKGNLVDVVGTGGAPLKTINISTISAFVVAGAGIPVAKHGNRSVTSICGSADLIEALGAKLALTPEQVQNVIEEVGIGFLFAPTFHPAMKYAAAPRKELGIRTIFNLLGPLTNPADAKYSILGVYDDSLVNKIAKVVQLLGYEKALVVYGIDGLDELSTLGETSIAELSAGSITTYKTTPEEFGLKRATPADIAGTNPQKSAEVCRSVLKGEGGAIRDVILLNSAAGIYVGGLTKSIKDGLSVAAESIDGGNAYQKMEDFIQATNKIR